jgi:hypothetical protein
MAAKVAVQNSNLIGKWAVRQSRIYVEKRRNSI